MLGGMGGELETDLPFKLVHPRPDSKVGYFVFDSLGLSFC